MEENKMAVFNTFQALQSNGGIIAEIIIFSLSA